jgi:hypothetical protein
MDREDRATTGRRSGFDIAAVFLQDGLADA